MRVVKRPDERKNEIVDAAEELFTTQGYSQTTIIDILRAVGIAKGTFYYYFKSKEEVMDAIILRIVEADVGRARLIADSPEESAVTKLFHILMGQLPRTDVRKGRLLEQLHLPSNAEMHQKSVVQSILQLTPVLADVIRQGIDEGVFATLYPQETTELLVAAAQIIFDEGLFQWEPQAAMQRAKAFIAMLEASLQAKPGTFQFVNELITGQR